MALPPGLELLGRSGPSIVIRSNPGTPAVDFLRSAADHCERLKLWTDPETGEQTERDVIIDAIAPSSQDTPDGPVHVLTLWYRYTDEAGGE